MVDVQCPLCNSTAVTHLVIIEKENSVLSPPVVLQFIRCSHCQKYHYLDTTKGRLIASASPAYLEGLLEWREEVKRKFGD